MAARQVLYQWAYKHGVLLQFIELGKPIHNAYIESFNARLREECLNEHVFVKLADARSKIEEWRIQYNRERPHSSLGNLRPEEFAAQASTEGARPLHAPLGQLKNCWPSQCHARRSRTQNLTDFRSPSGRAKGDWRNCAMNT